MKRFKVKQWDEQIVFEANTTEKIYKWLKKNASRLSLTICCSKDNIDWVSEEEFIESFESGECPADLQFF